MGNIFTVQIEYFLFAREENSEELLSTARICNVPNDQIIPSSSPLACSFPMISSDRMCPVRSFAINGSILVSYIAYVIPLLILPLTRFGGNCSALQPSIYFIFYFMSIKRFTINQSLIVRRLTLLHRQSTVS